MNVQDFIISRINDLVKNIKDVSVKYAYEESTKFHIIEIQPENIRRGNDDYINWEYSLNQEFSERFPEDDLLISEPCFFNDMRNVIFQKNIHSQDFINASSQTVSFSNFIISDKFENILDDDYSLAS